MQQRFGKNVDVHGRCMVAATQRAAPSPAPQQTARGVAVRRRDIPTLAAAKARERQAAGAAEELSKEGALLCAWFAATGECAGQCCRSLRMHTLSPDQPSARLHTTRADEARWLRGCRVIKSRFGTSKCWLCGETIDPGQKIAKRQSAAGRGGWAHAACLVHQRKGGGGGSAGQQEDEEAEEGGEGGEGSVEEEAPLPRKRKGGAAARSRKASSRAKRRRASEE